ncbi:uncharacterized protein I303_106049 [Kwoniella dejecticola CBS 10117]|uniref:Uncharacterized protein n=1 Tax=Kwoniella dejecticola CBS 10117 TaxID=1296121 RepID=A0AAJ8KS12_9TREE
MGDLCVMGRSVDQSNGHSPIRAFADERRQISLMQRLNYGLPFMGTRSRRKRTWEPQLYAGLGDYGYRA